tara:strand:- start:645 stop:1649 length:1005 start_codon:yes stop_codon:yes gene_type:complete
MSTASEIPYYLRPNKHIDRELFMELLSRVVPTWGTDTYCYFSMGGRHLIDQRMVYRRLGVQHLYSIDMDTEVVLRQEFNKPISSARCELKTSGELVSEFADLVELMDGPERAIVWLDYTTPRQRLNQINEFAEVARQLAPGEVVRITINAHAATLGSDRDWKEKGEYPSLAEYRAGRLKQQLGKLVPSTVSEVDQKTLPGVLMRCIKNALESKKVFENGTNKILALATCYEDGHRMLTVALLGVVAGEDIPRGLDSWSHKPADWSEFITINAPDLSTRERHALDQQLGASPDEVLDALRFLPAKGEERETSLMAVESYQRLHRFYPSFQNTDGI